MKPARPPYIADARRLIIVVLAVGSAGGVAIWIVVGALAGAPGVYTLIALCVLVFAAAARAPGA